MQAKTEQLVDLMARLNGAPDVEAFALAYLQGARAVMHAPGLGFDLLDPHTQRPTYTAGAGVSDFFLSLYETAGRAVDPVLAEAMRRHEPAVSSRLMSAREWRAHPVFRAVYGMHDFASVLQAPLVHDGAVLGVLSFGTNRTTIGAGDERTGATLARMVTPALVALHRREATERECRALRAALGICDQALVITDLARGERHMNRAARELLARLPPPWTLDDHLARAGECEPGAATCAPVRLVTGEAARLRTQTVASPVGGSGISIAILSLEGDDAPPLPASVSAVLTRREAAVAQRAAAGLRNAQIGRELGIAPSTVKQYLAAAYRKLDVRSRVELARRLRSM